MKREQIFSYIQGLKRKENREMDFYDLMLFAGFSLELAADLRSLTGKLTDPTKYLGKSVYIYGPQGAGKTVLAGHIFSETVKTGDFCGCTDGKNEINWITDKEKHPAYESDDGWRYAGPDFKWLQFCWYPGLIQQVKRSFNQDYTGPTEDILLTQVAEAEFLVLDDLGAEYASEWAKNFMYLLIEERKSNLRPTVFTSNYTLTQLAEKYDSNKIPSRIEGQCKNLILEMKGKDRRIK